MEHAKKLRLVDANLLGESDPRNVRKHFSELDSAMSDVLEGAEEDERVKVRLYQQALNKYLVNREAFEKELQKPIKVDVGKTAAEAPTAVDDNEDTVELPTTETIKKVGSKQKKKKKARWHDLVRAYRALHKSPSPPPQVVLDPDKDWQLFKTPMTSTRPQRLKKPSKRWQQYS